MDEVEPLTLAQRAEALTTAILDEPEQRDRAAVMALIAETLRAVARDERNRCADEIASHGTYQGRGGHFASIIWRGVAGRR